MSGLRISDRLALPVDVAGEAIAILAKRGAGKTNTATVLVEELAAAGVQTVILDPVGAWWGIRANADGERAGGLEVPILGGQHGDVPLEQTAGALLADVAVDTGQSLLLDLSDFPSKAATERFVLDFADRLFRRKARAPSLVHLVLEEADTFAPQSPKGGFRGDAGKMAAAVEQIVRRGRARGIGITMVTQRSAVLNKDVLSQADVLVAMRTTSPHDVKAIQLWVDAHGHDELGVVASLPSLETGEAWFWNPEHGLLDRVKVRRRRTFDSSATPKAGERRTQPRELAAIDLAALGAEIAKTAERAKADDPKELRKQIRELQAEIKERPTETQTVEVERIVEVPVLNGQVEDFHRAIEECGKLSLALKEPAELLVAAADTVMGAAERIADAVSRATSPASRPTRQLAPRPARERPQPAARPAQARPAPVMEGEEIELGKGERTVLDVLAEYPDGRTYNELAFLAGYSAKASTLGVILSKLRKAGLIDPGNQPVRPTAEGLATAGGLRERPVGQALLDQWLRHPRMGEGERRVLVELIRMYPEEPTHEELCEATGYSPIASTMGVILSKLRKLGLVQKGRRLIADEFMDAIEGAEVE